MRVGAPKMVGRGKRVPTLGWIEARRGGKLLKVEAMILARFSVRCWGIGRIEAVQERRQRTYHYNMKIRKLCWHLAD